MPETSGGKRRRARRIAFAIGSVAFAVEAFAVARRGYRLGGNVIVRCRKGHLFTTIWVPGASVKALRLGLVRFQRCPVGGHFSLVAPVAEASLSEPEREAARARRDLRVP